MPLAVARKLDNIYSRSSYVVATGLGEPFLNPDLLSILRYLKEKEAIVSLTSNGTVLTEERAQSLVDARVDRIVFSVDSPDPKTFSQIRIGADLAQILRNIERLVEIRAGSGQSLPYLILEVVAMAKNFHQLPQVADLAHRLGFDEVIVQNLFKHFAPGYDSFYRKNRLSALQPEDALAFWNEFQDRLKRYSIALYSPFQDGGIHDYLRKRETDQETESGMTADFLGYIDRPKPMENLGSSFQVAGWVLGKSGFPFTKVKVESSTDTVETPVSASLLRPDVLSSLPPSFPREPRCGFESAIDVTHLDPGVYTLSLRVRKEENQNWKTLTRQQVVIGGETDLRMYCSQPWSTIYVAWNGKIRTCCFNEYVLGDLQRTPFPKVWKGGPYKELRRKVILGQALEECADCLAGKSTPNDIVSLREFLQSMRSKIVENTPFND